MKPKTLSSLLALALTLPAWGNPEKPIHFGKCHKEINQAIKELSSTEFSQSGDVQLTEKDRTKSLKGEMFLLRDPNFSAFKIYREKNGDVSSYAFVRKTEVGTFEKHAIRTITFKLIDWYLTEFHLNSDCKIDHFVQKVYHHTFDLNDEPTQKLRIIMTISRPLCDAYRGIIETDKQKAIDIATIPRKFRKFIGKHKGVHNPIPHDTRFPVFNWLNPEAHYLESCSVFFRDQNDSKGHQSLNGILGDINRLNESLYWIQEHKKRQTIKT